MPKTTKLRLNLSKLCLEILRQVRPCGRVVIAMATDDVSNVNFDFKQFVTAVGIHAAINPL